VVGVGKLGDGEVLLEAVPDVLEIRDAAGDGNARIEPAVEPEAGCGLAPEVG